MRRGYYAILNVLIRESRKAVLVGSIGVLLIGEHAEKMLKLEY